MKKFSTLLKTLLVGLFACGAMSAWATPTVIKTYDFYTASATSEVEYSISTSGKTKFGQVECANLTGEWEGITLQGPTAWFLNRGGKHKYDGLYNNNGGGRLFGLLSLKAGDIVTVNANGGLPVTATNGTYDESNSTENSAIFTVTEDGNFAISLTRYFQITTVTITRDLADLEAPTYEIIGAKGNERLVSLSCLTNGANIKYNTTDDINSSGWTEYSEAFYTPEETIYAYSEKDANISDVITVSTGAGTVIQLNAPNIFPSALEANGNVFVASFNATNDQASVMFSPSATMTATFTDENGTSDITLPFKPTTDGTITVTATADGYETASASLSVAPQYIQSWISTDFSTLTDENAVSTLGDGWAVIEGTGRWSSWTAEKEPYTYYQYTEEGVSVPNVTVESNLRIRNVTILNLGYGLSRNVSEDIKFLNTTEGTIVAIKVYNGYGGDISDSNTYMDYRLNYGNGDPLFGCNNTRVLVQASYYIPASVTATIGSNGYATFASKYAVDFSETGLKAYKAAISDDGERVNFTEVTGAVRANTGLLIEGTANESYTIPVVASGEGISGNDFKVNTSGSTFSPAENTTYFAMVKDSDPLTFGTVNPETVAIPANKAYLAVTNASASRMTVTFNSETTGIKTIESSTDTKAIYNLNGQRIKKTQKGLYIMNGKKAIVK